jgi:hypothetical protein
MRNKLNDCLLSDDEIKEIQLKNETDKQIAKELSDIADRMLSKRYKKININSEVVLSGLGKIIKLQNLREKKIIIMYSWLIPVMLISLLFLMAIIMTINNVPIRKDIPFYAISGLIMIFSGFMAYRTHKSLIKIKNNLGKLD